MSESQDQTQASTPDQSLNRLRKQVREKRASLSASKQREHAEALAQQARDISWIANIRSVISYAPFNGEISPDPLMDVIEPVRIFVPKIVDYQQNVMTFVPRGVNNQTNRFGISEPESYDVRKETSDIADFDLVLMPVVGFDRQGNRLGMGGGYYDRALANVKSHSRKPILLGLAHSFQELAKIQAREWDISVDAILTETEYIAINPNL